MIKRLVRSVLIFTALLPLYAQDVSQEKLVRFAVWAQIDAIPGIEDAEDEFIAVHRIKETAPFLVEGIVSGWYFDYTPSDKARNVEEFFELTPITKLSNTQTHKIRYAKPWVQGSRLWCWVEYERDNNQIDYYKSWLGIQYPRIKGVGRAKLSDGFAGIQKASQEALKNAVRDYERTKIKNKPREIKGRVLICEEPEIGIDAGQYKVTLDFFIETDRIKEYKTF